MCATKVSRALKSVLLVHHPPRTCSALERRHYLTSQNERSVPAANYIERRLVCAGTRCTHRRRRNQLDRRYRGANDQGRNPDLRLEGSALSVSAPRRKLTCFGLRRAIVYGTTGGPGPELNWQAPSYYAWLSRNTYHVMGNAGPAGAGALLRGAPGYTPSSRWNGLFVDKRRRCPSRSGRGYPLQPQLATHMP